MPLPAIAIAAARVGAGAARGAGRGARAAGRKLGKRGFGPGGSGGGGAEKPRALSPEGVTMLALAGVLEIANVIIGILDFAFGIGVLLGPVVNAAGTFLIGGWLWMRFGKLPLKKVLGPLVLNSIPLAKFIPWWFLSVATSVDWKNAPPQETQQTEQSLPAPQQTEPAPTQ